MSASDYLENASLDKTFRNVDYTITTVYGSLHDGRPGDTGLNEIAGGSYARQSVSWNAAALGITDNNGTIAWTTLPASTLLAIGFWDALTSGNLLSWGWLGGFSWKPFTVTDTANDIIVSPQHGYQVNHRVTFDSEIAGILPNGMIIGTVYHVISITDDTFKISTTQGGASIDLTSVGSGHVVQVSPAVVAAGEGFQIVNGGAVAQQL